MQIKQSLVMLVVLSLLLFVSTAEKNKTLDQQTEEEQKKSAPQYNWKLMRHSLDHVFFSSKRRVPNESDPLHNR